MSRVEPPKKSTYSPTFRLFSVWKKEKAAKPDFHVRVAAEKP
jgi:hypothetical protein